MTVASEKHSAHILLSLLSVSLCGFECSMGLHLRFGSVSVDGNRASDGTGLDYQGDVKMVTTYKH